MSKNLYGSDDSLITAGIIHDETEAKTQAALNANIIGDLATKYSSSATYAVGDYVLYNDDLYRCISAITTAEAWNSAHWTAEPAGDALGKLWKEHIYYGVCATGASTQQKSVTISEIKALYDGLQIRVKFNSAQSYNGPPTLNLNSFGAKGIYRTTGSSAGLNEWEGGETVDLIYEITYGRWVIVHGGVVKKTNDLRASLNKTEEGLAYIVDGDTCTTAVPAGAFAYIKNNTHSLTEGLYRNKSGSSFPTSGGTANGTVFEAVSGGGLNDLKNSITPKKISGVDLNNVIEIGEYILTGSITNSPFGNFGYLKVAPIGNLATDVVQIYINQNTGDVYIRNYYENAWRAWKKVTTGSV